MAEEKQKGRVLIVEDDMLLAMVEERLIQSLGFTVVDKVGNGCDAIDKTFELVPDVIIMDISLNGDLDGIETMERIRERSDVPVVYLSGNAERYNYERARKTGFSDYLKKPITRGELKAPLYKAMNSSHQSSSGSSYNQTA